VSESPSFPPEPRPFAGEARLRQILDASPVPTLLLEPGSARVLYANRAAEVLTGGAFRLDDAAMAALAARGGALRGLEACWASPAGERTCRLDAEALPATDEAPAVVVVTLEDVTAPRPAEGRRIEQDLRLANERLLQADRYKDEFLSVISHELRTPLNFITGFASLLEDAVLGAVNPTQRDALRKIMNGADRMLRLVDDLLDFAKLQSGRFELLPEPTACRPLVEEVVALMRPLADAKRIEIDVDVDVPGTPLLDGDRVSQVLTNLVSNGLKFTPAGGALVVRGFDRGGDVVFEVADTGVGIAPADVPKLFHRFRQLDMGATRQASGTGLGLAICKAIVEVHGGRIGVESAPGVGSKFWFALPREGPPAG
jgi:signal transduction histidine kinase